jgi:hypothetical protein
MPEEEKKNEKEKGPGTVASIIILAIILFFVGVFVWYFWEKAITQQMFDRDCVPMGWNVWGFVDEWKCPPYP